MPIIFLWFFQTWFTLKIDICFLSFQMVFSYLSCRLWTMETRDNATWLKKICQELKPNRGKTQSEIQKCFVNSELFFCISEFLCKYEERNGLHVKLFNVFLIRRYFIWLCGVWCVDNDQGKQTCSACNIHNCAKKVQNSQRKVPTRNGDILNILLSHLNNIKL